MAGVPALPSWPDVELSALGLARLGMAQLNSARVALLGHDAPRWISSHQHYRALIADGQLLIGCPWPGRRRVDCGRRSEESGGAQAGQGNGMAEPLPREAQAGSRWSFPAATRRIAEAHSVQVSDG